MVRTFSEHEPAVFDTMRVPESTMDLMFSESRNADREAAHGAEAAPNLIIRETGGTAAETQCRPASYPDSVSELLHALVIIQSYPVQDFLPDPRHKMRPNLPLINVV